MKQLLLLNKTKIMMVTRTTWKQSKFQRMHQSNRSYYNPEAEPKLRENPVENFVQERSGICTQRELWIGETSLVRQH